MSDAMVRWVVAAADRAGLRLSRRGPLVLDVTRGDGRRGALFAAADEDSSSGMIALRAEDEQAPPARMAGAPLEGRGYTLRCAPPIAAAPMERTLDMLSEYAPGPYNVTATPRLFCFSGQTRAPEAPLVFAALADCWVLGQPWQRDAVDPRHPRLDAAAVQAFARGLAGPADDENKRWEAAPPAPVSERLLQWTRHSLAHTDAVAERRGDGVEVRWRAEAGRLFVVPMPGDGTVSIAAFVPGLSAGLRLSLQREIGWLGAVFAWFETPIDDAELDRAYVVKANPAGVQFATAHRDHLLALAPFHLQLRLDDEGLRLRLHVHQSQAALRLCMHPLTLFLEQLMPAAQPAPLR